MNATEFLRKWMEKDDPAFIADVAALINHGRKKGVSAERRRCAAVARKRRCVFSCGNLIYNEISGKADPEPSKGI